MRGSNDHDRLEALRERLYARGVPERESERTPLPDEPVVVPTTWATPPEVVPEPIVMPTVVTHSQSTSVSMPTSRKRRTLRLRILLAGIGFFLLAVIASSVMMLIGGNTISGENIAISINGPFTIGGGDVLSLQIGITNQNSVAIESASLIVEYPLGTKSADDENKDLFVERLPLSSIKPGETLNIPLRAQIFGEENQELTIKASVEYRVKDSNATFYKEAEPLRVKVSASPVVMSVDADTALASGQPVDLTVTLRSNSPEVLNDIALKAEYPSGFEYTSADPAPTSGRNLWLIKSLKPEESVTVRITGMVFGNTTDERVVNLTLGVPDPKDQNILVSIFSTASHVFTIEQPFVDVGLSVGGVTGETITVSPDSQAAISINLKNTLSTAIYDAVVVASLSGTGLTDDQVTVSDGYYDANTNTVRWDSTLRPSLLELKPGSAETFAFTLLPRNAGIQTPEVHVEVSAKARRLSEPSSAEALIGVARTTMKVASGMTLISEIGYDRDIFDDTGPIPPVAGTPTTYTISLMTQSGSNSVSDVTVTQVLPPYVSWKDATTGSGLFTYNPSTRVVEWKVDSIPARGSAMASYQVSFLPSASQIDTTPVVVGEQYLKAKDDFTSTTVETSRAPLTTKLPEAPGRDRFNGNVRASGF